MNKYESLYVIVPELNEEETASVIEKFSGIIAANGGEIEKVDEWGKRRLAYTIDYKKVTMCSLPSAHPLQHPPSSSVI